MTETRPQGDHVNDAVPAVIERELRMVREAIAMVASGYAPRVTLAGLHFGEALLEQATGWATAEGVRLTPLWRTDEAGVDLAIEAERR
ncbi:MAG: hypothetical protein HY262_07635 [Chloroflexi bacterium]|nr:hypothetical protein [Chloroflexota bacterium]